MWAKNIITSTLGIDEYFRVSNCTNAMEMWDTLQLTHEDTTDVERSRVNTLTHEYELFRMIHSRNTGGRFKWFKGIWGNVEW